MFKHWIFDAAMGFYSAFGGAGAWYLWNCRTPMVASVRRLRAPKIDTSAELHLHSSSDVGMV